MTHWAFILTSSIRVEYSMHPITHPMIPLPLQVVPKAAFGMQLLLASPYSLQERIGESSTCRPKLYILGRCSVMFKSSLGLKPWCETKQIGMVRTVEDVNSCVQSRIAAYSFYLESSTGNRNLGRALIMHEQSMGKSELHRAENNTHAWRLFEQWSSLGALLRKTRQGVRLLCTMGQLGGCIIKKSCTTRLGHRYWVSISK